MYFMQELLSISVINVVDGGQGIQTTLDRFLVFAWFVVIDIKCAL